MRRPKTIYVLIILYFLDLAANVWSLANYNTNATYIFFAEKGLAYVYLGFQGTLIGLYALTLCAFFLPYRGALYVALSSVMVSIVGWVLVTHSITNNRDLARRAYMLAFTRQNLPVNMEAIHAALKPNIMWYVTIGVVVYYLLLAIAMLFKQDYINGGAS